MLILDPKIFECDRGGGWTLNGGHSLMKMDLAIQHGGGIMESYSFA